MNTKDIKEIYKRLSSLHPDAKCELNFSTPFELLIAVILSAQCTDKRVNIITDKLFKTYNKPEDFANLTVDELKEFIFSCGFYNNKGKNIIKMSKALMEKHNGEVPQTMEELVALDGVGRKTASVVLTVAFGVPAMPVDTHVLRVSRRLGLAKSVTADKVEKELMNIIEKEDWHDFHHYLIFHGRYICHSRKPDCKKCNLTNYCNFYKENKREDTV
ncbi:MAG: endonuclease III [Bacillota bacterium]